MTECKVVLGDHQLYFIHSFAEDDATCFDNSRLNVYQTSFGQNIAFSMRTFRFIVDGESTTESQSQTIHCDLYLEPVDNVAEEQALWFTAII